MTQALGAIQGHAQATVTPTSTELELIAGYEQSDAFFSSDLLRQYSQGGPAPTWPAGGTYQFSFPDPKNPGKTVTVVTPDPGRALITSEVRDVNFFKIPPLWGIKNTAPYFHDNSANTLEELLDHYADHLALPI